ncbi:UNVERIFIED_CONTAM: hypothetical protein Slati_2479800 [Sesamum latifolium]|uniref:Retrotransposon gag domain-containing protein n=1 Tax=Sesamum latifolium TaxID=2727402 RepID=A0AAW2WF38_9LAMI
MIEDASAQAASRAVAQYVAEHALPPQAPRQPGRGHGAGSAPENNEMASRSKTRDQGGGEQTSLPEDELPPPPPREAPQKKKRSQRRGRAATRQASIRGKNTAGLPIRTIDSFEQLSQRFLHHFAINKRYPKTASYLFTVIQQEHESMGRFRESIAGKSPATLDELLVRAEKYIRIEETSDVRTVTPSKRRAEEEGHSRRPPNDNQRDRIRGPPPDIIRYTPLKAPRAEILAVAERHGIVQWPLQMIKNSKRMKSDRYCFFHKDRGHSTEECLHLNDEIEKLIRRGYLKKYVDRNNRSREGNSRPPREGRERETRQNQPNQDNPPTTGVIGVISGGLAGGDSATARKAALRSANNIAYESFGSKIMMNEESREKQEIIFGSQDLEKDVATNNDAVVISATIANFWVKKVLVDSGSSVDIIFYKAFS